MAQQEAAGADEPESGGAERAGADEALDAGGAECAGCASVACEAEFADVDDALIVNEANIIDSAGLIFYDKYKAAGSTESAEGDSADAAAGDRL